MYHRYAKNLGFTVLEMVMVMVIIAIIAIIATPRYISSMDRYRAEAAAGRIVAELQEVHSRARATSQGRTVDFDLAGNRMRIINAATASLERIVDLSCEPYMAKFVEVDFNGNANVTFDGYGQPQTSGKIAVQSGSTLQTILLNDQTGQAQVLE